MLDLSRIYFTKPLSTANMKRCFYLIVLSQLVTKGIMGTSCITTHKTKLLCQFSQNINSTQTDFIVYFDHDIGGEEPLVDCEWVKSQLHCINQAGVHLQVPVLYTAEIIMPARLSDRNGSYRCLIQGHNIQQMRSCRFPTAVGSSLSHNAALLPYVMEMVAVSLAAFADF